jgi:hypothetical protein
MRNLILALAGFVLLCGSANAAGTAGSKVRVIATTASTSLTLADSGIETFIYASGVHTLTLPDCDSLLQDGTNGGAFATVGTVFNIVTGGSSVVTVDTSPATDDLRLNGTLIGVGESIDSAAAAGEYVKLVCVADNEWDAVIELGTWVDGGSPP